MNTQRCQSCAQPMGPNNKGTYADGRPSSTYCGMCFQDGVFSDPGATMDGMIAKSVNHMTTKLGMPLEDAQQLAEDVIPGLKRWNNRSKF